MALAKLHEGGRRVVIEAIQPSIDDGLYPIKRILGDQIEVTSVLFADGHDEIAADLLYRHERSSNWQRTRLHPTGNDLWNASFCAEKIGHYHYTIQAWIDHFSSWQRDLKKWAAAGEDISTMLLRGSHMLQQIALRATKADAKKLRVAAQDLIHHSELHPTAPYALAQEIVEIARRYPDLKLATTYHKELDVIVDRKKAQFSTWYELFPRSTAPHANQHGTFRDCEALLPYIAEMGFDVLYLPPVHPIGAAFRKGKNNALVAEAEDVGSPWAIGSADGGHTALHQELGSLEDFRHLVARAREHQIELALDIALQCSPDHPYVHQHPEWFLQRADGTIQYAENPPKKYQDIYPLNFEASAWRTLWNELRDIFLFWVKQDVRIFRVDNPHTKAFPFWEWLIADIKRSHPDVIFLAEAFTRPHVMYGLAKRGFSQSYTYFAWRNTQQEIREYFEEITQTPVREFFRANLWPNTPDILHETLQAGGCPAFKMRYVLAATLGANCGIYGPAYELCENRPVRHGSEEYLDSEKYQLRAWDRSAEHSIAPLIAQVNHIRHEHPALQQDHRLHFHNTDNPMLICYSKVLEDASDMILAVVNLDCGSTQSGWTALNLSALGIREDETYTVRDLLTDAKYSWQGAHNYISLNPEMMPAHIFYIRRHLD